MILPIALAATMVPLAIGQKDGGSKGKNADKIAPNLPEKAFAEAKKKRKLLVFSRTTGFRHGSIATGLTAMKMMGEKTGAFEAILSDDLNNFESDKINQFDAILFLNTTGDPFMEKGKPDAKKQRTDPMMRGLGVAGVEMTRAKFRRMRSVPLLERLAVRRSHIHGWGLYTKVDVERDDFIIEWARGVPRRCLHFNTTRVHQTMPWGVSFPILR